MGHPHGRGTRRSPDRCGTSAARPRRRERRRRQTFSHTAIAIVGHDPGSELEVSEHRPGDAGSARRRSRPARLPPPPTAPPSPDPVRPPSLAPPRIARPADPAPARVERPAWGHAISAAWGFGGSVIVSCVKRRAARPLFPRGCSICHRPSAPDSGTATLALPLRPSRIVLRCARSLAAL
jgi:hypothetical protein